jgi:hypothetical protein
MPFTFAHPAIVLPATYLPKKYYSLSALIIGSMTPDFEYFIRMRDYSKYSHTWSGAIWFDLPLGLILLFLYHNLVRNTMIEHLPFGLNARFSAFEKLNWNKYFRKNVLVVIISLFVGIASHIFWDSFTHDWGYFTNNIPELKNNMRIFDYEITGAGFVQDASSVVGSIIMLIYIFRMPKGNYTRRKKIFNFWILVGLMMVSIVNFRLYFGPLRGYQLIYDLAVTVISGFFIGIIVVSALLKWKEHIPIYRNWVIPK